VSYSEKVKRL